MSTIDLVMCYQRCSLIEAVRWICARWEVPMIAKNTKFSRPERWTGNRVGLSNLQPIESLVRSGYWATLGDAERAVLVSLLVFSENGEATISYRGLARHSGKSSDTTIRRVLSRLQADGLLQFRSQSKAVRDVGCYRLTSDNPRFEALISAVHTKLLVERDMEMRLRSEMKGRRLPSNPNPQPNSIPRSNTHSTTVESSASAHSTTVERGVGKEQGFDCQVHGPGCVDERGYPRCWDGILQ